MKGKGDKNAAQKTAHQPDLTQAQEGVVQEVPASATPTSKRDLCTFALEYAPYGICFMNEAGQIVSINRCLTNWLEDTVHHLEQQTLKQFIYPKDRALFGRSFARIVKSDKGVYDTEVRLIGQEGSPRWVAMSLSRLPGPSENLIIAHLADITRRKRTEKEWMDLATQDHLTGLSNRMVFEEALNRAVKNAQRYNRQGAVLYIDIDHFKLINDRFGHKAGDEILKEMGKALHTIFRDTDTAARIGGDEFAIIMEEGTEAKAQQKARLIDQAMKKIQVMAHGKPVQVSVSIGIRLFSGDDIQAIENIVAAADQNMYAAKIATRRT